MIVGTRAQVVRLASVGKGLNSRAGEFEDDVRIVPQVESDPDTSSYPAHQIPVERRPMWRIPTVIILTDVSCRSSWRIPMALSRNTGGLI